MLITDIRAQQHKFASNDDLFNTIDRLREETCRVASQMEQEQRQRDQDLEQQETGQRRHKFLRRVAFAVGGGTVITANAVVDAGLIAVSFGTFPVPVATSLSASVGGALVGDALSSG